MKKVELVHVKRSGNLAFRVKCGNLMRDPSSLDMHVLHVFHHTIALNIHEQVKREFRASFLLISTNIKVAARFVLVYNTNEC